MKIQLVTKPLSEIKTEYVVLPIYEDRKSPFNGIVSDFLADNPKFGKPLDTQLLYSKMTKFVLIGIGKKEKIDFAAVQNWIGTAVRYLVSKTKQVSIIMPQVDSLNSEEVGEAVAIGAEIGGFDPTKAYKSDSEPDKLNSLEIVVSRAEKGYQDGLKEGQIIAQSINLARKLSDMPANEMTPTYFLNEAKRIAKDNKLKISVIDEKMAKKMGMGAFVGVAQGSDEPSYMISLEYKGDIKSKDKWAIVGKGITFDTGGLNLKPDKHLSDMQYDMCGAAAALAIIETIAKLGVRTNIAAVMAVTENMPGGKAQRPGDIVRSYCGKTIEIGNTDAEGRLVLIDALAYAQKDLKTNKLIDLATLTGGIIAALGDFYTGVLGNNSEFTESLIQASKNVGEKMWQLPMDEEFAENVKSEVADLSNIGTNLASPSSAHAIMGAKFLEAAIENNNPWIHLDIAGSAIDKKKKPFRNVGATGAGIKTVVKLIQG